MKKGLKFLLILLIVAAVGYGLVSTGAIQHLKDIHKLQELISGLGMWGPLVFVIIFMLVTVTCISVVPVAVVGGLVFGPVKGVLFAAIGAGLGLSAAFLIARYVARDAIEKKFGNTEVFKKINKGVETDGWFILAITRFLPIFPFGIQNYVYGLTSINFLQYAILSTLFILPGSSVFVILAGAVASGDTAKAGKMAVAASLILLGLIVVTKLIAKKVKK